MNLFLRIINSDKGSFSKNSWKSLEELSKEIKNINLGIKVIFLWLNRPTILVSFVNSLRLPLTLRDLLLILIIKGGKTFWTIFKIERYCPTGSHLVLNLKVKSELETFILLTISNQTVESFKRAPSRTFIFLVTILFLTLLLDFFS